MLALVVTFQYCSSTLCFAISLSYLDAIHHDRNPNEKLDRDNASTENRQQSHVACTSVLVTGSARLYAALSQVSAALSKDKKEEKPTFADLLWKV